MIVTDVHLYKNIEEKAQEHWSSQLLLGTDTNNSWVNIKKKEG